MFCHTLTSIVKDKNPPQKLQSFTRGEASVILNDCIDYWNGENIKPISSQIRRDVEGIVAQWNESYETIGFSYKPITGKIAEKFFDSSTSLDDFDKLGDEKFKQSLREC